MEKEKREKIKWTLIALGYFILSAIMFGEWLVISLIIEGSFFNWGLLYAIMGLVFMIVGVEYVKKICGFITDKERGENVRRKK